MTTINLTVPFWPIFMGLLSYFALSIISREENWYMELISLAFGAIVFLMLTGLLALIG